MKAPTDGTKLCRPLSDLANDPDNLRKILGLYLDPSLPGRIEWNADELLFQASGTGYDGDPQMMGMHINGRICRFGLVNGRLAYELPSEVGKILYMLKSMGYWLYGANLYQARLYEKYIRTGVSNLVKRDAIDHF
jgi:hypothetical protein